MNIKHKQLCAILTCSYLFATISSTVASAVIPPNAIYDETKHTAFITEKEAQWVDADNHLASLSLSVNGTQVYEPLDVIFCLDRSGSMDMDYIQQGAYTHTASSPCLNQAHFYLKPIPKDSDLIPESTWSTDDLIYNANQKTLTVYNEEQNRWVELNAAKPFHLYSAFDDDTLEYAAYHFKKDANGDYVRISKWDTSDIRKGDKAGIWDHADAAEECYDRWSEAKNAVTGISQALLNANPENHVAVVPFSIRDSTLLEYYAGTNMTYHNSWLTDNNTAYQNALANGTYNAQVPWTNDISNISSALDEIFTTPSTDYVYGLSMAYNILQARPDDAKENRHPVVVFLSDGVPWPESGTVYASTGKIAAFYNPQIHIKALSEAIKNEAGTQVSASFLGQTSGIYQRHDIAPAYVSNNSVTALGAHLVTVAYMTDSEKAESLLKAMASTPESYIHIPADDTGSTQGYLEQRLLDTALFPGGRNSVLQDVISPYFEVDESRWNDCLGELADCVQLVRTQENNTVTETIVWDLGSIYKYGAADEPTLTIPLVLKEEYRTVNVPTYYPTNADQGPAQDLTTPERGADGPNNGAALAYTDPANKTHYHTIGSPKLPVLPTNTPSLPNPGKPGKPGSGAPAPSPTPDPGAPPQTIEPPKVPQLPDPNPGGAELTDIPPDDVPLGGSPLDDLPQTGDEQTSRAWLFLCTSASLTGLLVLTTKKQHQ